MSKKDRDNSEPRRTNATDDDEAAADTGGAAAQAELEQLRTERDQLQEQLQRTLADLQNIRRRQGSELQEWRRKTLEGVCHELLPVLDNFHTALEFWDSQDADQRRDATSLVEGVRMVRTLLTGALERHGLQEIPATDQDFDPNLHEAVGVEAVADVPQGRVVRVLQRGYLMGDRVIRPSRVVVSGAADGGDPAPGDGTAPEQAT